MTTTNELIGTWKRTGLTDAEIIDKLATIVENCVEVVPQTDGGYLVHGRDRYLDFSLLRP